VNESQGLSVERPCAARYWFRADWPYFALRAQGGCRYVRRRFGGESQETMPMATGSGLRKSLATKFDVTPTMARFRLNTSGVLLQVQRARRSRTTA